MRSEQEVNRAIEQYSDTVRRLCMIHLKNDADTEDIFQTVFLKYVLSSVRFESQAHEKAWFIRVTVNACKDLLALPPKYRDVVYLHYYEAYTAPEIGQILGKNVNTVYTLLTRSKQMLRKKLGGDGDA